MEQKFQKCIWLGNKYGWTKVKKSICFDFQEKGKNIITLTVIIDISSKCQVLFQIKKIKYNFKHNGWFEHKEKKREKGT